MTDPPRFLGPDGLLRVRGDAPLDQLREVAAAVGLSDRAIFSRCTRCNLPLEPAPREEVEARAPATARAEGKPVRRCPGCGRLYWEGSHTGRMRRSVAEALGPGTD